MLLQLALEGQSSLARALLPTVQSNHAPAICPSMLLPFCRSCYRPNMLLPFCQADQRWDANAAGHSTATMLLTFCHFLQNNQRFYLFKHVRKAKLRLFCQAVQTQSSHDPMIPCTVEQADFVCRMYCTPVYVFRGGHFAPSVLIFLALWFPPFLFTPWFQKYQT